MKKFTCHRDGTVTFYNGFDWERSASIPSHVWNSFTPANTAIHGLTAAEQKEIRSEAAADERHDRKTYAEMSQVERDAYNNL